MPWPTRHLRAKAWMCLCALHSGADEDSECVYLNKCPLLLTKLLLEIPRGGESGTMITP